MKPNLHSIQVILWEHEVVDGFQPQLFPRAAEADKDGETRLTMGYHVELGLNLCNVEGKGELVCSEGNQAFLGSSPTKRWFFQSWPFPTHTTISLPPICDPST